MGNAVKRYLRLFFELQLAQWQNYAQGAKHDLSRLDAALYACLREETCLSGCSPEAQPIYAAIRRRGLVDRHPQVSRLRNRLDDWDNYGAGLTEEVRKDSQAYRVALARRMRPDVLQLMALRQNLARARGCSSYPHLVLQTEGLDYDWTRAQVTRYLQRHLPTGRRLIAAHDIKWNTWWSDLRLLGELPLVDDAQALAASLLQRLGLADAWPRISLHIREDGLAGYTGVITPGADVHVLVRPVRSLSALATLCHELGHACYHALRRAEGWQQLWSSSYDEAMAVLLEWVGLHVLLGEGTRLRRTQEIALLENVRCAISYLFELELWQAPEQAEPLYLQHYGRLGLDLGEPLLWALDSFRSIDPMYIQNYVLGAIVAEQMLTRWLNSYGHDYEAWGREIRQLYALGHSSSLISTMGREQI
ncbi:MAG: hypothetical protein ACOX2K_08440 [Bacillota bacterium]